MKQDRMRTVALSLALMLTISVIVVGGGAYSDDAYGDPVTVGGFSVDGGTQDRDYTYSGGVLTVVENGANLTITTPSQTGDRIVIASGITVTLTLSGVNISSTSSPVSVPSGSNLILILSEGSQNSLAVTGQDHTYDGGEHAGISLPSGASLTIRGTGSLNVTGYAAGIGGDAGRHGEWASDNPTEPTDGGSSGNVTIEGGTVIVTGRHGAGIGGGNGGDAWGHIDYGDDGAEYQGEYIGVGGNCGDVTITGGTVTITGGEGAAGIGGGRGGDGYNGGNGGSCGTVIITGASGTITGGNGMQIGSITSGYGNTVGAPAVGGGSGGDVGSKDDYGPTTVAEGVGGNGGDLSAILLSSDVILKGGNKSIALGGGMGGSKPTDIPDYEAPDSQNGRHGSTGILVIVNGTVSGDMGTTSTSILPSDDNNLNLSGNLTLPFDLTIPEGKTLSVPSGTTLTLPSGRTLTVNGLFNVTGKFNNNGTVVGDTTSYCGDLTVLNGLPASEFNYDVGNKVINVIGSKQFTVKNTDGGSNSTDTRIVVAENVHANIILSGVNMKPGATLSPIELSAGSSLRITLADGTSNTLYGGSDDGSAPGIHVPEGTTLLIDGNGSITVGATGESNTAFAGIGGRGGDTGENMGSVYISSGNVNVYGRIGGGSGSTAGADGSLVTIGGTLTRGNVTFNGAGIRMSSSGNNVFEVFGNLTLIHDLSMPSSCTLTVSAGNSLTIAEGVTLTFNLGTFAVDENTFTNNGHLELVGAVTVTGYGDDAHIFRNSDMSLDYGGVTTYEYNAQMQVHGVVSRAAGGGTASDGTVTAYSGPDGTGAVIGTANVGANGTFDITVTLSLDVPSSPHTISFVYGGGTGLMSCVRNIEGLTINITNQNAPAAPTSGGVTDTTVTLNPVDGSAGFGLVQYSFTAPGEDTSALDSRWQYGTTFRNLKFNVQYTFYARFAGDVNHNPSAPSAGTTILTARVGPAAGDGYTLDYVNETISFGGTYEVSTTSDFQDQIPGGSNISSYLGGSIYIRFAASGDMPASMPTRIDLSLQNPDVSVDYAMENVVIPAGYYYNFSTGDRTGSGWTQGNGSPVSLPAETNMWVYRGATDTQFRSNVVNLGPIHRCAIEPAWAAILSDGVTLGVRDHSAHMGYPTVFVIDLNPGANIGTTEMPPVNERRYYNATGSTINIYDLGYTGEQLTVHCAFYSPGHQYSGYHKNAYWSDRGTINGYSYNTSVEYVINTREPTPDPPTIVEGSIKDVSVDINFPENTKGANTGLEYRVNGGDWHGVDPGVHTVTGLTAASRNSIELRYGYDWGHTPLPFIASGPTEPIYVDTYPLAAEPPAATVTAVTSTSISVQYDASWEYSMDQVTWTAQYEYSSLSPGTDYTIYVRIKATASTIPSNIATVTATTPFAQPADGEGYTIDAHHNMVVSAGYEISTDVNFGTILSSPYSLSDHPSDQNLYIRHAATDKIQASPSTQVTVPNLPRMDVPASVPTAYDFATETIVGDWSALQYRVGTDGPWMDCGNPTSLYSVLTTSEITLYFRTAGDATHYAGPASETTLTLPARPAAPSVPQFTTDNTSITAAGYQISLDGVTWQDSLTDLVEGAHYMVYIRTAPTDSSFGSMTTQTSVRTTGNPGPVPSYEDVDIVQHQGNYYLTSVNQDGSSSASITVEITVPADGPAVFTDDLADVMISMMGQVSISGTKVYRVSSIGDTSSTVTVSLTPSTVKKILDTGLTLAISGGVGSIELSPEAATAMAALTDNPVFTISRIALDGTQDGMVAIHDSIGSSPLYELTAKTGDNNVTLGGNVTVVIPYTPAANETITVVNVATDGTQTPVDHTYANGYVSFTTDHFSYYAIVSQPDSGGGSGGGSDGNGLLFAGVGVAAVLVAILGFVLYRRRA